MWYSKDRDKEWHSKDANTHPAKKKKKKNKKPIDNGPHLCYNGSGTLLKCINYTKPRVSMQL
jgi:hypothetical protein